MDINRVEEPFVVTKICRTDKKNPPRPPNYNNKAQKCECKPGVKALGHDAHRQPALQDLLQDQQDQQLQPAEARDREQRPQGAVPARAPGRLQVLRGSAGHVRERLRDGRQVLGVRLSELPQRLHKEQEDHPRLLGARQHASR